MDKPIYKVGQWVRFRAIIVNRSLEPVISDTTYKIYIEDSKGNRIKHWNVVFSKRGIVSKEFQLSDKTNLGEWSVIVDISNEMFQKSFTVSEYVLPSFEVQILTKSFATFRNPELIANIKAFYTYGKPVVGDLSLKVNLNIRFNERYNEKINVFQNNVKINGSFLQHINLNRDLSLDIHGFGLYPERDIEIEAIVMDCVTGIKHSNNVSIQFFDLEYKIDLIKYSKTFKPGLTYFASIKLSHHDNTPVDSNDKTLKIFYGISENHKDLSNELILSPERGLMNIEIQTPVDSKDKTLSINAEYDGQTYVLAVIESAKSQSNNFIKLIMCKECAFTVGNNITFGLISTEFINRISYEVIAKGDIVLDETVEITNIDTFKIYILLTHKMSPQARIFIHYMRIETLEIVADSMDFDVNGLFRTNITIETNVNETNPGDLVDIMFETLPHAFVGCLAIDQSVLLLKTGNELSQQDVIDEFSNYSKPHNILSLQSTSEEIFDYIGLVILKGQILEKTHYRTDAAHDGNEYSSSSETEMSSNSDDNQEGEEEEEEEDVKDAKEEEEDVEEKGHTIKFMSDVNKVKPTERVQTPIVQNQIRLRQYFPETWLWIDTIVGDNGTSIISSTVPDTITSWYISAFAIDQVNGLGIATNNAKVTVFRPFFIKMSLPYSIIRGETIQLQAVIYNYMNEEIKAKFIIENENNEFEIPKSINETILNNINKIIKLVNIPSNTGVPVYFKIKPRVLGYIELKLSAIASNVGDSVIKYILVKPEGQTESFNIPYFVNLMDANKPLLRFFKKQIIQIPKYAVKGSESITISVTGDILGPTINNMDKLLQLPTDCGEQNMLNFVPNIVILDYLINSNRLTQKIKYKALKNIEIGYQRELTFKLLDGSFNYNGQEYLGGNTWLTTYVVKSFNQAKPYIYVDQKVIDKSIQWLLNQQNSDGSFNEGSKTVTTSIKGGLMGEAAITAYVLIALIKDRNVKIVNKTQIDKAVNYIKENINANENIYDITIMTLALHLAKSDKRHFAFDKLINRATKESEYLFWKLNEENLNNAIDIEITSYALMILVLRNDFQRSIQVLEWLISKQTNSGGFFTTQDTVIAIQALGELAKKITTDSVSLAFEFNLNSKDMTFTEQLLIDSESALNLQLINIPISTQFVETKAIGYGAAIVQISWQYNILKIAPINPHIFFIRSGRNDLSNKEYLQQDVCTFYKAGNTSGMAVMEFELPSGYVADVSILKALNWKSRSDLIDTVETENGDTLVVISFSTITSDMLCLTIPAKRSFDVHDLQTVSIAVYTYYDRSQLSKIFYKPTPNPEVDFCF